MINLNFLLIFGHLLIGPEPCVLIVHDQNFTDNFVIFIDCLFLLCPCQFCNFIFVVVSLSLQLVVDQDSFEFPFVIFFIVLVVRQKIHNHCFFLRQKDFATIFICIFNVFPTKICTSYLSIRWIQHCNIICIHQLVVAKVNPNVFGIFNDWTIPCFLGCVCAESLSVENNFLLCIFSCWLIHYLTIVCILLTYK